VSGPGAVRAGAADGSTVGVRVRWRHSGSFTLVIELGGELDARTVRAAQAEILRLVAAEGRCRVILDLGGLTLLDPAGVGLLGTVRRAARRSGFRLILTGADHRPVELPLRIAGMLPLFETRCSLASALS
jgi:anti-anti-sigma factor